MNSPDKQYRYPGVQPFSSAQHNIFFGRRSDTERLLSLMLLERLSVLFGKSGHGKSSLLNAGILPALEEKGAKLKRRFVPVMVRFNNWTQQDTQTLYDKFLFHLRQALQTAGIPAAPPGIPALPQSLWGAVKQWSPTPETGLVIMFDQFEEFFSYPSEQQETFKQQLAELLYTDYPQFVEENEDSLNPAQVAFLSEKTDARALFSIRADRLSDLDRLKDRLPAILHKRYELQALNAEQAREAIVSPAAVDAEKNGQGADTYRSPAYTYEEAALRIMLQELSGSSGNAEGAIEAFQLQIVCASIEKRVSEDKTFRVVTAKDLPDFNRVYEDYYKDRIGELPLDDRPSARRLLEQGLLLVDQQTGEARRLSRDAGELAQAFELTPSLLQNLERTYLIRREVNTLGGFNYEISHDTLIAPVLKARREMEAEMEKHRKEQERRETEQRAREAEEKVLTEAARRKEAERLQAAAEKGQRRARFFSYLASAVAILAIAALLFAWQQRDIAKSRQAEAETSARKAEEALQKYRDAEIAREKAEADKIWREVEDILGRAERLQRNYPETAAKMKNDALKILDNFPNNTILQEKRKSLNR